MNNTLTLKNNELTVEEILNDYRLAQESRQASILGRKEVFAGKAKFGIFGDGKELPQLAMAKAFQPGDFRSGYYRDQTLMWAIEGLSVQQYFAQLYAHTNVEADPSSAGRLMNGHFASRMLDEKGNWKNLTKMKLTTADVSPTAAQIPRLVGLGLASKLYRNNPELEDFENFSINGNEVAFGTIGNAATSEGIFLEAVNAIGVLQIPVILAVWDDGYGISVPNEYHTTKGDLSKALEGFRRNEDGDGFQIYRVPGWDYQALCDVFLEAAQLARQDHIPSIVHVVELTQPLGHSSSGSHERYKSKERLEWELEFDCNKKMREWILENEFALPEQLEEIEKKAVQTALTAKNAAWNAYYKEMNSDIKQAGKLLEACAAESKHSDEIKKMKKEIGKAIYPLRSNAIKAIKLSLRLTRNEKISVKSKLQQWLHEITVANHERYSSQMYSSSDQAAIKVKEIKPSYSKDSPILDGREILNHCFDAALARDSRILAFGEDVGKIGDVNQAFAGLQKKYGEMRVTDTGIRETTIIGQGIGLALRGFKPIAEIQYLDYLIYTLQTLTDDLACLQYRTKGGQKAPMIIRTRGHRLEGVWHSGSPMGLVIHSMRGIYVIAPRNMTQAAGFYNTMLQSDDPALIVESLNGYRLKEQLPDNIGEFTVPLGVPEVLKEGNDVTVVTYGSMCRIVVDAANQLEEVGISCEVIDVQTLLPFDIHHSILKSVKKTNRVIFADEDVPGGASSFMMQKVLEEQGAYNYLDSPPLTLTSHEHRPAYGTDGDYFSKPNAEDVFDKVYYIMSEVDPKKFPPYYREYHFKPDFTGGL